MAYIANDLKDSRFHEALPVINEEWTNHKELIDATYESLYQDEGDSRQAINSEQPCFD